MDTNKFIEKSNRIWNFIYDYTITKYVNSSNYIKYICKKHGVIEQLPSNHYKYGCPKCGRDKNKRNNELREDCIINFEEKANKVHNNKYSYEKVIYKNAITHVIIICHEHGDFKQSPNNHLRGKGCPKCGILSVSLTKVIPFETFLIKAFEKYKEKYNYDNVLWNGTSKYIEVLCLKHGLFKIYPYLHLKGKECPKCNNRYSKISISWLNFMEIKYKIKIKNALNDYEYSIPGTRYKADGYCLETNTIFEYNGDFWHGNPKIYNPEKLNIKVNETFGELYRKTLEKEKKIKELGYNLVSIWEYDWLRFIKTIKTIQSNYITYKNKK
jgi:hypothetical protein